MFRIVSEGEERVVSKTQFDGFRLPYIAIEEEIEIARDLRCAQNGSIPVSFQRILFPPVSPRFDFRNGERSVGYLRTF